jgi:hypothetical protein
VNAVSAHARIIARKADYRVVGSGGQRSSTGGHASQPGRNQLELVLPGAEINRLIGRAAYEMANHPKDGSD